MQESEGQKQIARRIDYQTTSDERWLAKDCCQDGSGMLALSNSPAGALTPAHPIADEKAKPLEQAQWQIGPSRFGPYALELPKQILTAQAHELHGVLF